MDLEHLISPGKKEAFKDLGMNKIFPVTRDGE